MSCSCEAYLEGSKLPLAAVAGRGWGTARWLTGLHKGVMEGDMFGSLPQAAWARRRRDTEGIYLGLCHQVRDFKL